MDNFRRRTRGNQRQAIDGIVNAPIRSQGASPQPQQGRRAVRFDGLRSSNGRRVDDFRRSEGFHVSQSNGVRSSAAQPTPSKRAPQPSLLHKSLEANPITTDSKKKEGRRAKAPTGKQSRWRTFRKWGFRSALALGILTFVLGGFLVLKGIFKVNKVFKGGGAAAALESEVTPDLLKGEGDGRVNILLLGKGGPGQTGADLTDTIIVASIDPVNKSTTLVSVPRDLWVTVPGSGSSRMG